MSLRDAMTVRALVAVLAMASPLPAQQRAPADAPGSAADQALKQLYIPDEVNRVPEGNDYDDPASDFSFARMVEGPNVAIFWHREYGDVPMVNPDSSRTFNPYRMLEETERYYRYYVEEMEYLRKGESVSDDRKLLVYVYGGEGGTAFGGGTDSVGIFWTPAVRVNREPYGVIAHELAHSFQYMSRQDAGTGARGGVNEMAAQYFLWQVLPGWQTFENYHLEDFMGKTHHAFLHGTNIYHSPYVIEYWSNEHGLTFWGDLNRRTEPGEDVVQTYKRLQGMSQEAFNDEMFDAARRFVTWDLNRLQDTSKPYRNQHESELVAAEGPGDGPGWYRIAPSRAPQNYGYNAIALAAPSVETEVRLTFTGMAGAAGYDSKNVELAGWRYGFVAYRSDGTRVYSDAWSDPEGSATFTVPADTEHLWLVVMGAPTEHFPVVGRRRGGDDAAEQPAEEAWPYRVKLANTSILGEFIR